MLEIHIDTSEVDAYLNDLERRQVPKALAKAMNASMVDAQRAVRESAYRRVFTTRNKALPKALTTIPKLHWADRLNLRVTMMNVKPANRAFRAGEGFIERQINNRAKIPKGSKIAIPQLGPGLRRSKGGVITKGKRPRAMGDKLVRIKSGLFEKMRNGKLRYRYALASRAAPNKAGPFRYYATGIKVIHRVLPGHWATQMNRALRTAKR